MSMWQPMRRQNTGFQGGMFSGRRQAPMESPAPVANRPMQRAPQPQTQSSNAQLSSSTPVKADPQPQENPGYVGSPLQQVYSRTAPVIDERYTTPGTFPERPRFEQGPGGNVDDGRVFTNQPTNPQMQPASIDEPRLVASVQQKIADGSLSMTDVQAVRQMGNDALANAIMRVLAGMPFEYTSSLPPVDTPTPVTGAPVRPTAPPRGDPRANQTPVVRPPVVRDPSGLPMQTTLREGVHPWSPPGAVYGGQSAPPTAPIPQQGIGTPVSGYDDVQREAFVSPRTAPGKPRYRAWAPNAGGIYTG